jgi:hypothetical protein
VEILISQAGLLAVAVLLLTHQHTALTTVLLVEVEKVAAETELTGRLLLALQPVVNIILWVKIILAAVAVAVARSTAHLLGIIFFMVQDKVTLAETAEVE